MSFAGKPKTKPGHNTIESWTKPIPSRLRISLRRSWAAIRVHGKVIRKATGRSAATASRRHTGTDRQLVHQVKESRLRRHADQFFDFLPDLDFFGKRVMLLLHQAGLRIENASSQRSKTDRRRVPANIEDRPLPSDDRIRPPNRPDRR